MSSNSCDPSYNECAKCIEKGKDTCCVCKTCLCRCGCARMAPSAGSRALVDTLVPPPPVESSPFKTTLFTDDELAGLRDSYRAKKDSLRRTAVVDKAVEYYYQICMSNRANILAGLHTNIESWKEVNGERLKWSYAFSFISVPYLKTWQITRDVLHLETTFEAYGYKKSMWKIYRHTDFCTKLLSRLGLDPTHFGFKNLSYPEEDGTIMNKVNLVFTC